MEIGPEFINYPGTNSVDEQGPTPGIFENEYLTLDTPLRPFVRPMSDSQANLDQKFEANYLTSKDVIDISKLGYTYEYQPPLKGEPIPPPHAQVRVPGIHRGSVKGSFTVSVMADLNDGNGPRVIGSEAVLSRWHTSGCTNCQTHSRTDVHFPVYGLSDEQRDQLSGKKPGDTGIKLATVVTTHAGHDDGFEGVAPDFDKLRRNRQVPTLLAVA